MKRGAGASVFGYFWGNAKSDWPRAAMERARGMRSWFDRLTTNGMRFSSVHRPLTLPLSREGRGDKAAWERGPNRVATTARGLE